MSKIFKLFALMFAVMLASSCTKSDAELDETIARLKSADSKVRSKAALDIAGFGGRATRAVPLLAAMLKDANAGVKSAAAYALREIGGPVAEKALEDNSTWKDRN